MVQMRSRNHSRKSLKAEAISILIRVDVVARQVGGKLAELLVDAAVTPLPNGSSVRAFWQETVFERGPGRVQKMGYLVANPAVLRQIEANEEVCFQIDAGDLIAGSQQFRARAGEHTSSGRECAEAVVEHPGLLLWRTKRA